MIRAVLWDVDGTLLDFAAAEEAAIRKGFCHFGLGEISDEKLAEYAALNTRYWKRLEKGEITRQQVLVGRFEEFFAANGWDPGLAAAFNDLYQENLGETAIYMDHGREIVESLKGKVLQLAITNGSLIAQKKKLALSGLDQLFDGIYISEEIGHDKPSMEFFQPVLKRLTEELGDYTMDEILVVGDSLTSDMKGAEAIGAIAVWFDPEGRPVPEGIRYRIRSLKELPEILAQEAESRK